jgi:hypothetical protein
MEGWRRRNDVGTSGARGVCTRFSDGLHALGGYRREVIIVGNVCSRMRSWTIRGLLRPKCEYMGTSATQKAHNDGGALD